MIDTLSGVALLLILLLAPIFMLGLAILVAPRGEIEEPALPVRKRLHGLPPWFSQLDLERVDLMPMGDPTGRWRRLVSSRGPFQFELWADPGSAENGREQLMMSVHSHRLAVRRFLAPTLREDAYLSPVHPVAELPPELRSGLDHEGAWRWHSVGKCDINATWIGSEGGPLQHASTFERGYQVLFGLARHLLAEQILMVPPRMPGGMPGSADPFDPDAPEWVCSSCGAPGARGATCRECAAPTVALASLRAEAAQGLGVSDNLRLLFRCPDVAAKEEGIQILQAHRIFAVTFAEPGAICVYNRDIDEARRLFPDLQAS